MIDVTGVDLVKFVQEVYALSRPQGLGMMHYQEGGLSEDDARGVVARSEGDKSLAVRMDYVHGRACKMRVWRKGNRLEINDRWFDHSAADLTDLLRRLNIGQEAA